MSDEVKSAAPISASTPPPAASSTPSSSPTPVVATTVESVAPVVSNTPVDQPVAPVVETPVPDQTPVEAPKPETPLGTDPDAPSEEVAPVVEEAPKSPEGDKPAEEKKDEAGQSAEPAPLPTFESFKLPEGLTADPDAFTNLTSMLGEFEVKTKANHDEVQAFGQSLVDRHVEQLNKTIKQVSDVWAQNWENQKKDWFESFKSDPEIGGNRMDTTLAAARQFIRTHGGTPQQQQEFRDLMNTSGVGNHPAVIRMLAKASKVMSEGRPLPASSPVSEKKGRAATLYGGK